jgi:hypothetical protein
MPKRFVIPAIAVIAILVFSPLARAQQGLIGGRVPGAVYDVDKRGEKSGPAPRRSLAGIWEPAQGQGAGIAGKGALAMLSCKTDSAKPGGWAIDPNPPLTDTGYATPNCLKPDIGPEYTPLGLERLKAHKPTEGYRMVADADNNDPLLRWCDPKGWPRSILHNYRTSEIFETPTHIGILYKYQQKFRIIWTDGRALPKDPENPAWSTKYARPPESRWWGYAVGKWVDDYTFVAQTAGFNDDRTWLDNAGLPQSDAMVVEETYHRVDADHLEVSIKIIDPKLYKKPWIALDKFPLRLQPNYVDMEEMECSQSDQDHYYKLFGDLTGSAADEATKDK